MAKINIKKQNVGKFTAWATAHGMTVQQAAATILRNREKYSPTLIKRANFARNAGKWEDGGMTEYGMGGFLQALSPLASLIPGVGGAISGLMSGVGGSMEQGEQQSMLATKKAHDNAIASAQAGQAGAINPYQSTFKIGGTFKGKKFGGKPNAELEGGEVFITPDGSPTNLGGPSHAQGGVDLQLPNNTMILSDKVKVGKGQTAADVARPYTSKINKAQAVVSGNATKLAKQSAKLNLNKYYSKVLDTYNKQEAKKFGKGGLAKFDGGGVYPYQSVGNKDPLSKYVWPFDQRGQTSTNPYALGQANVVGKRSTAGGQSTPFAAGQTIMGTDSDPSLRYNAPNDLMDIQPELGSLNNAYPGGVKFSNPLDDPNSPQFNQGASKAQTLAGSSFNKGEGFDWGNALGDVGAMAPMLYNLFAGKPKDINEARYNNPYEGQINSLMGNRRYNIDPELAANENAFRTTAANMRNLGGSRGQVMSNLTGAQNTKQFGDMSAYAQKKNMENQYAGEQANMLYGLGRDKTSGRIAHDEAEAMDQASFRNMKGAAMTGLQQYLLTKRQMKNQSARDKMLGSVMNGFSPFMKQWFGPEFEEFLKTKK
jgi:hypothetical protein